ncbi:MAG: GGDEF domain-containing protein [Anaerolineales bacterium]|nr:GGDEF domain-containing protein [Anaerolineales bacterium]GJQ36457.1 MAG: hypothetical protein JETCAE01_24670 [Anaerolineaceae bacterium]
MKFITRKVFETTNRPIWFGLSFLLLVSVGILDYTTGTELSFSLFYLLPIAVASLGLGNNYGILMSLLSTVIWLYIEVISHPRGENLLLHLWNAVIRLGFFLLPALLLKSLERERLHARTDFLTGAYNHRYFHEVLEMEINRSARYNLTFTVVFLDTDNFKIINDTFGHVFGDGILATIADTMKNTLRKTDFVARVGGDEFSILLPETNESEAKVAISNLRNKLTSEMKARNCPITFSIGILTLHAPQLSADQALNLADKLMYWVKNNGKDNVRYETHWEKTGNSDERTAPPTRPRS